MAKGTGASGAGRGNAIGGRLARAARIIGGRVAAQQGNRARAVRAGAGGNAARRLRQGNTIARTNAAGQVVGRVRLPGGRRRR